jgi:hypothetical protein
MHYLPLFFQAHGCNIYFADVDMVALQEKIDATVSHMKSTVRTVLLDSSLKPTLLLPHLENLAKLYIQAEMVYCKLAGVY